jgi:hypothetical protein
LLRSGADTAVPSQPYRFVRPIVFVRANLAGQIVGVIAGMVVNLLETRAMPNAHKRIAAFAVKTKKNAKRAALKRKTDGASFHIRTRQCHGALPRRLCALRLRRIHVGIGARGREGDRLTNRKEHVMALTIKDALRLAQKDSRFAAELVSHPESLKAQFNLTDAQIQQLKNLATAAKKTQTTSGLGHAADYH